MTDAERIAAFLATKGATVVAAAPAYGVDKEHDKVQRAKARAEREYSRIEHEAEMRFQRGVEENGYYKS